MIAAASLKIELSNLKLLTVAVLDEFQRKLSGGVWD